jgi:hypothetical protein
MLFLAGSSATSASGFNGLYATTPMLSSTSYNLPDSIYQSTDVYGIYIRLDWNAIQPAKRKYDWSTLDAETSRAVQYGKQISIAVATGMYSPGWLYHEGVDHATFIVDSQAGVGKCLKVTLPMPWDLTYQNEYAAMMSALSAHLQNTGYSQLQSVKVTVVGDDTEEMHLPAETGPHKGGCRRVTDAVTIFQQHNYRPSNVIGAWETGAQSVASAFPGLVLGIAIWNNNDFPLIDDNGNELTSERDPGWVDVKGDIVSAGISTYPGLFMVSWNGLGQTEQSQVVINAGANGAIEGWQTNMHNGSTRQAGCDSKAGHDYATCTVSPYQSILDNGIANGGQYLEIWPNDLFAFPDAVDEAQSKL